jgi:hypothetical protein
MPNGYGWEWRRNEAHDIDELVDTAGVVHPPRRAGAVLAWIQPRPPHCDRGHFMASVEYVPGLDAQDGFPRYFMELGTAKREIELFLAWRLYRDDRQRERG